MQGVFGLNGETYCGFVALEENGATSESIVCNLALSYFFISGVHGATICPIAITLFLEQEWYVVESTTNISIFIDEMSVQNGLPWVVNSLRFWFAKTCNNLLIELDEMHFTIMG